MNENNEAVKETDQQPAEAAAETIQKPADAGTDEPEIVSESTEDLTIHPLAEGETLSRAQRDVWEARADEILEKIRPYIQHDGGDCQLLGIDEQGVAYVTFLGACAGCMMAGEDFSTGIRLLLLDEFPELKEVVLVG